MFRTVTRYALLMRSGWHRIGGRTPMRELLAVVCVSCLTAFGNWSVSQAASSTSPQEHVIFVDGANASASDENPGSIEAPVQTIGRATELAGEYNAKSVPVRVTIAPGVYRESFSLFADEHTTSAPLVLEAADQGVTISGSAVWTGWTGGAGGIYAHPWRYRWGLSALPDGWEGYATDYLVRNPVIRRREMVFMDGQALRQVMTIQDMESLENSFFVAEEEGQIFIHVAGGIDLGATTVEVAVRPYLLQIGSRENVTVSGLTFEHASSPVEGYAVSVASSSQVHLINDRFVWNNWSGLVLYEDEDVTLQGLAADHNGVSGITGSRVRGLLVEDSQASYNNWRGSSGWNVDDHELAIDANFIDFATGQKFFSLRDATFDNYRAIGNLTGGLWLDYDNADVTLKEVVLQDNLTHGLMLEASQGPISVVDSKICGNEVGIIANNASNVRVEDSVLAGNLLGQVFLAGGEEPRPVTEYDTGKQIGVISENWVVQRDSFSTGTDSKALGTYLGDVGWSVYVDSLQSDQNDYSNPTSDEIFGVPGGETVGLDRWRAETGEDASSTFSLAEGGCVLSSSQGGSSPNVGTDASEEPPAAVANSSSSIGRALIVGIVALASLVLASYAIRRRNRLTR